MSGTIWLIAESDKDAEIVKAILKRRYPQVRVEHSTASGGKPNLSRLARQVERLIQQAIDRRRSGDCIAVLHDLDMHTRPHDRADYERIERVCRQYRVEVKRVIAEDEIESWLLSDPGLCKWLGDRPQNWDNRPKPSGEIARRLDRANKPRYREENLNKILENMTGTGDQFSPSLKRALAHLENAPCVQP